LEEQVNNKIRLDASTEVVREQIIDVQVPQDLLLEDVDTIKVRINIPGNRPRTVAFLAQQPIGGRY
jgi:hypothetical protein